MLFMTPPAGSRRRYRIILRGECKHLLTGILDGLLVETCRGWTCVVASVRDESELYGLLERFQEFALHIVSLNELDPGPEAGAVGKPGLDMRTQALVRLAALVATDETHAGYHQAVATALDHGVTPDEITGVLAALPPAEGAAGLAAAGAAIRGAIDRAAAG
jgi:alkylhydroperoxidase/carboxymuconolactone decarboxylase family protein YurZ